MVERSIPHLKRKSVIQSMLYDIMTGYLLNQKRMKIFLKKKYLVYFIEAPIIMRFWDIDVSLQEKKYV